MIQLDNTKGMEIYSFSDAEVNAAHDILPYYGQSTIPSRTYAGIGYTTERNA